VSVECVEDIHKYLIDVCRLHRNAQEVFLVLAVNAKGFIIGSMTAGVGDLCSVPVHPREIFKFAIASNTGGIICAHNHPSEIITPSDLDIEVTRSLQMQERFWASHS